MCPNDVGLLFHLYFESHCCYHQYFCFVRLLCWTIFHFHIFILVLGSCVNEILVPMCPLFMSTLSIELDILNFHLLSFCLLFSILHNKILCFPFLLRLYCLNMFVFFSLFFFVSLHFLFRF